MEKTEYTTGNLDIFQGYYGSLLYSPDMEIDYNNMAYNDTEDEVEYELDFKGYTEEMNRHITDKIMEYGVNKEDGIIKSMTYKSMWSPKHYNFTTDKLELEVEVDMDKLKSWVEVHKVGFDKYLYRFYTPCSGWIPFVANNYDEYVEEDRHHDVMVDYYLLTNIFNSDDFLDMDINDTDYMQDIIEQVNETFSEHMIPIE